MAEEHSKIVDYWARVEDESGLSVDWADAHKRCWRCGYRSTLERCHIVPKSRGGADSPSNLVLLCIKCHREAPNHTNPKYMWIWLRAHAVPLYNTYWTSRAWQEFEKMFGRRWLDWLDGLELTEKELDAVRKRHMELYHREFDRSIIHFGEGRLNASTLASMLAEAEEVVAKDYGIDVYKLPQSDTSNTVEFFATLLGRSLRR